MALIKRRGTKVPLTLPYLIKYLKSLFYGSD